MLGRRRHLLGFAGLVACLAYTAPAQALDWEQLGEQDVSLGAQDATLAVKSKDDYVKIKLIVRENSLDVLSVKVKFSDGSVQEFPLGAVILAGSEPAVLTLSKARSLQRVELGLRVTGSRKQRRRKAQRKAGVALWGLPAKGRKRRKSKKARWAPLGEQKLKARARSVTIRVTSSDRFKGLGLKVSGRALEVTGLEIRFASGRTKKVAIRHRFDPADETYAVDLQGEAASMKDVVVRYKAPSAGRATIVHLFGRGRSADGGDASHPPRSWRVLGERILDKTQDRATISVAAGKGGCRKIRLRVMTGKVELKEVVVHFLNAKTLRAKLDLGARKQTGAIEFPGERQVLKIVLSYEVLSSTPALVRLKGGS